MKQIFTLFLPAITMLLFTCSKNSLDLQQVEELLSKQYPIPLNFKVPIDEEEFLQRASSSNLEEEGWLTIERHSFLTTGRAIRFTNKAKPYLLPMSRLDMEMHLRPIKLADTEFIKVTGIH